MWNTRQIATAVVVTAGISAGLTALTGDTASSKQTINQGPAQTAVIPERAALLPPECAGETWPYESRACIEAIGAKNGIKRDVRVVTLYEQARPIMPQQYAEAIIELRR